MIGEGGRAEAYGEGVQEIVRGKCRQIEKCALAKRMIINALKSDSARCNHFRSENFVYRRIEI